MCSFLLVIRTYIAIRTYVAIHSYSYRTLFVGFSKIFFQNDVG